MPIKEEEFLDPLEQERLDELLLFENQARLEGFNLVAGVDEAGRGPLAGPVVAAACLLPEKFLLSGINDSKKLTAQRRGELFEKLTTHPLVCYGIGIVSHEEIDRLNILQASLQAMDIAVANLPVQPHLVLVDGNKALERFPSRCIVQGDSKSLSVAAASIIAKVVRDKLMLQIHQAHPQYGFDRHKGYGTALHLESLARYGPCPYHRLSFAPVKAANQRQFELGF